jgi:hypothetical protein
LVGAVDDRSLTVAALTNGRRWRGRAGYIAAGSSWGTDLWSVKPTGDSEIGRYVTVQVSPLANSFSNVPAPSFSLAVRIWPKTESSYNRPGTSRKTPSGVG